MACNRSGSVASFTASASYSERFAVASCGRPTALRRLAATRPANRSPSTVMTANDDGTAERLRRDWIADAVQALGKVPVDVEGLPVDLYTISGHKIYAPKGAGALYVRKGVKFGPIMFGGHHERDRPPGTENVPGAAGLGAGGGGGGQSDDERG